MSTPEEEAKKALEEMNRRMQSFHAGYVDAGSEFEQWESRKKLRLFLVVGGVSLALIASIVFYFIGTHKPVKRPPVVIPGATYPGDKK